MTPRPILPICTLCLVAFLAVWPPPAAGSDILSPNPIDAEWAVKWRQDLAFAQENIPKNHIRIAHTTPQAELDAAIDDLARRIPTLTHQQAVVELARIVAMIGDGHTRLTMPIDPHSGFLGGHRPTEQATLPGTPFRHYPVRFFLYDDGLAVERAASELLTAQQTDLLGARVVRLGSMTTEEAMAAVEPVVHRDNRIQVLQILPDYLVIPEILEARDVIDSLGPLTLELEAPDGRRHEVTVEPVPLGQETAWADRPEESIPLFRRRLDQNYRFEYFEAEKTVYFRYVTVLNEEEGESLPEFARRMFAFIEMRPVERLVIDLRGNGGGNNWLNAPLERGVIRAEKLWRPGALVVLTDRYTFSAAMNFASFLADTTPAIFLGESTGGRPNHYGDARQLVLPNTGLTLRLSTVYHQDASAEDDREQIDPHIPVSLTAADIRSGRDPVLEEPLGWSNAGDPSGTWRGPATMRHYTTEVALTLQSDENGWSGTFAASGWMEDTEIDAVELSDGEVRFDVPLETTTIRVRAWPTRDLVSGDRLVGMFDYQGQWYPFVAARSLQ